MKERRGKGCEMKWKEERKKERNGKEEANWDWHWLIGRLLFIVGCFDKIGHLKKFEKKRDTNSREREKRRGKEEKRTLETIARVCIYGRCGRCAKLGEPD